MRSTEQLNGFGQIPRFDNAARGTSAAVTLQQCGSEVTGHTSEATAESAATTR